MTPRTAADQHQKSATLKTYAKDNKGQTPARWALHDTRHPVEASIAAIVDRVEVYRDACREPAFAFLPGSEPTDLQERQP